MSDLFRFMRAAVVLTALSVVAFAQAQLPNNIGAQGDLLPAVGPPIVTVIEVKNLGVAGNNVRLRVKWNAQLPSTTKLERFTVFLTVTNKEGAPTALNQTVDAAAREVIFTTPNRTPKSFKALVESFFTTIATQSQALSDNFTLSKSNGFVAGNKFDRPTDAVTKVSVGSGLDLSKFDVFWAFRAGVRPPGLSEIKSIIKGDFVYRAAGGANPSIINRSATLNAPAGARQIQFSFPGSPKLKNGETLQSIEAAINVTIIFTLTQHKESAPLEGVL